MRGSDVRTNDWTGDRTKEGGASKACSGSPSAFRIPEVDVGASNNGDGSGTEATGEEARKHDCRKVLSNGEGDLEDNEDGESKEERTCASIDFGKRSPNKWS